MIDNKKNIKIARKIIQIIGIIFGIISFLSLFFLVYAFWNALVILKFKKLGLSVILLIPIVFLLLFFIHTSIIIWCDFSRKAIKRLTLVISISSFIILTKITNYIETIYKIKLEDEVSINSVILILAPLFIAYIIYQITLKALIRLTKPEINLTFRNTIDHEKNSL